MKIKLSEFRKMVVEEMKNLGMLAETGKKDSLEATEDVEAVEVEPGGEGRENVKKQDMVKALKIKEAKLIKALAETRAALKKHRV
jgi:hypothetical protein